MPAKPTTDPRSRVAEICLALPEATEERMAQHAAYLVRDRRRDGRRGSRRTASCANIGS